MDCIHPIVVNGLLVPCQQCHVCLAKNRNDWSFRLRQEMSDLSRCYFVTLTYDEASIPKEKLPIVKNLWKVPNLSAGDLYFYPIKSHNERKDLFLGGQSYYKGDIKYLPISEPSFTNYLLQPLENRVFDVKSYGSREQCFSKRDIDCFFRYLRKDRPGIRYFLVSEYGGEFHRPHYHLIFFNCPFPLDEMRQLVEKTWRRGRTQVVPVTNGRIHYITKYALKDSDQFGSAPRSSPLYPFRRFSTGRFGSGGLGSKYIAKMTDFHINDNEHYRLYVNLGGDRRLRLPRYYKDRIFDDDMRCRIRVNSPPYDVNYLKMLHFVESTSFCQRYELDVNMQDNILNRIKKYGKDKYQE